MFVALEVSCLAPVSTDLIDGILFSIFAIVLIKTYTSAAMFVQSP